MLAPTPTPPAALSAERAASPATDPSDPHGLTEVQRHFRDGVRAFARAEIAPSAAEYDAREAWPAENVAKMAARGLMGISVPARYGGAGLGALEYALGMEELAWACASHAMAASALVIDPLLAFGTEPQRQALLPDLARGEMLGAYCLTEPEAGSDAASLRTTARRDGAAWVLNGAKSWITHAGVAGIYLVYARSDPRSPRGRGITAFLVPAGTPGLRVGEREKKMGIRASDTRQVFLDDVRVPESAVLGEVDQGFRVAMAALDGGRVSTAALAVGIAQRALDEAVRASRARLAPAGSPGFEDQGTAWTLADMATRIEAARLLTHRAARLRDAGQSHAREASMAKLVASETATFCARAAVQVLGDDGARRDAPVEKLFRDARITEIYEGTSEIQRLVIARHLLRR